MQLMPRHVDPEERREAIVDAAMRCLAESGPKALTIRGIAKEMGGSVTTITHYYPSRQDIITDLNFRLEEEWKTEMGELKTSHDDPAKRLWNTLDWLLPIDEVAKREEQMRLALLASHEVELLQPAREQFNRQIEDFLADCLKPFLPEDDVRPAVDSLRAFISGIILSCAEFPDEWTPERQRRLLSDNLRLMGLPHGP